MIELANAQKKCDSLLDLIIVKLRIAEQFLLKDVPKMSCQCIIQSS